MEIALLLLLLLVADGAMGSMPSATVIGGTKGVIRQVARDSREAAGAWNDGRRAAMRQSRRGRALLRVEGAVAGGVRGTSRSVSTGWREGAREGRARRREKTQRKQVARDLRNEARAQARAEARAERKARRARQKADRAQERVDEFGIQEQGDPDPSDTVAAGRISPGFDLGGYTEEEIAASWGDGPDEVVWMPSPGPLPPLELNLPAAGESTTTGGTTSTDQSDTTTEPGEPLMHGMSTYGRGPSHGTPMSSDENVEAVATMMLQAARLMEAALESAEALHLGQEVTALISDAIDHATVAAGKAGAMFQPMIEAATETGSGVLGGAAASAFAAS